MNVFLVILGLIAAGLLATSKPAYRLRRHRFVATIISGGWLSLLIGVILGPAVTGIVTRESVFHSIPLLVVGLGWVGFMIGFQIRSSVLFKLPAAVYRILLADVALTVVLMGVIAYTGLRLWLDDAPLVELWLPISFIITASIGWKLESRSVATGANEHLAAIIQIVGTLGSAISIIIFGLATKAVERNPEGLLLFEPDRAMLKALHTVLLALALGIIGRFITRLAGQRPGHQFTAFLGIVAFAAGSAKQIDVSPLFTAMLTGAVVANIKGMRLRQFETFIIKAEHVLAILFGILAGILLEPRMAPAAFILALALVIARGGAKPVLFRRIALLENAGMPEDKKLPAHSPLYLAAARQSPIMLVLAVSLVIIEPSILNKQLLALMAIVGVLSEFAPLLAHRDHHVALDAEEVQP